MFDNKKLKFDATLQTKISDIPNKNAFNAVRLFLCMIVIFMHCLNKVEIYNRFLLDGYTAVCGFFVISGFWISKSYLCSKNIKTFFIKRIKKIFPMYYISLIGFSLLCVYFSDLQVKEYFCKEYLEYLFWNAIFLNFVHPNLPGCFNSQAVNGALWTIKVEIGFYLIAPIIITVWEKIKTTKCKNIFLTLLYLFSILYKVILKNFAEKWNLPLQLEHQLPAFISCFVSGMLIFFNLNFFLKVKNFIILPCIAIFALHYFTNTEFFLPISLAVIIVFSSLTFKSLSTIGKEIDFSWGMYLFHFPLMQILYFSGNAKNIPAYTSSVIGIAFCLTFVTEKYIQKRIK
ncbi:MAG: acyltransferase family protein [Treponemataceae bacterium]